MAIEFSGKKACKKCGKRKHVTEFGIARAQADGRNKLCLVCTRAKSEEHRIRQRQGKANHRMLRYDLPPNGQRVPGFKIA